MMFKWTSGLLLVVMVVVRSASMVLAAQEATESCHFYRTKEKCLINHCTWCEAGAVPSACYTAEEAAALPPAVFECTDKQRLSYYPLEDYEEEAGVPKDAPVPPAHELVFDDSVDLLTGMMTKKEPPMEACHFYRTEEKCLLNHCTWCKCAAVPSACYSAKEAAGLPAGIFDCTTGMHDVNWELKSVPQSDLTARGLFALWQQQQSKQYMSQTEEDFRFGVFMDNIKKIAAHNARENVSFSMEVNKFADITWEEFQRFYLGASQNCSATWTSTPNQVYDNVPDEIDWRDAGIVSPVKNQGKCGSCWTFSTTGCLESHLKQKHGKMILLSEQNLLDCAQAFDNHGCDGGLPSHAFEYVHYNGGIDTEQAYPYRANASTQCHFSPKYVGAQVDSVVNITSRNEEDLKGAVGTVGPVSVAYQCLDDFMFYKSGVYVSSKCRSGEQDVNHAVLAVGYGTTDVEASEEGTTAPLDFWIVKNSWGADWGMNGFFLFKRGTNMCGIADCASYPIMH